MQSVLSPIVGRLSDTLDGSTFAAVPPLIAFAGAVVSAKATSMNMLIGGGILIGITLPPSRLFRPFRARSCP